MTRIWQLMSSCKAPLQSWEWSALAGCRPQHLQLQLMLMQSAQTWLQSITKCTSCCEFTWFWVWRKLSYLLHQHQTCPPEAPATVQQEREMKVRLPICALRQQKYWLHLCVCHTASQHQCEIYTIHSPALFDSEPFYIFKEALAKEHSQSGGENSSAFLPDSNNCRWKQEPSSPPKMNKVSRLRTTRHVN